MARPLQLPAPVSSGPNPLRLDRFTTCGSASRHSQLVSLKPKGVSNGAGYAGLCPSTVSYRQCSWQLTAQSFQTSCLEQHRIDCFSPGLNGDVFVYHGRPLEGKLLGPSQNEIPQFDLWQVRTKRAPTIAGRVLYFLCPCRIV